LFLSEILVEDFGLWRDAGRRGNYAESSKKREGA
jgi:hypothetical protein